MDEENLLYLATRKRDMIIRGGENIYPIEIENRLDEGAAEVAHPDVIDRDSGSQRVVTLGNPLGQGSPSASAFGGIDWTEWSIGCAVASESLTG